MMAVGPDAGSSYSGRRRSWLASADMGLPSSIEATGDGSGRGDLVVARPEGLYCPPGDFYIDPWRPVDRAVITHGHGIMYSYADRVPPADRWAIAAYIRALQKIPGERS